MKVDPQKIGSLLRSPARSGKSDELRREDQIFWVGCELPARETVETIFDSDCASPAELFCLAFDTPGQFRRAEELVRLLKKNFSGFLLGRFQQTPDTVLLDSTYASGIDLIDIPLSPGGFCGNGDKLDALAYARTVFPRWSVLATIPAAEPLSSALRTIDDLLARGVLPLVTISEPDAGQPEELAHLFSHLARSWRRSGAALKPLLPLLRLTTPLVTPPPRTGLSRLLDRMDSTRLRTSSDLRRLLRVRQVKESFESAGL